MASTERQALVTFSESAIWQDLRTFYKDEGVDSWSGKVPFFATSNAFLAESCFQVIRTFWMESARQIGDASDKHFLLLELGAGHGRFSFYLLRRLYEWHKTTAQSFTFVYIMSDLAKANLEFWENNPAFTPYLEKNVLDFAVWDAESGDELQTESNRSGWGRVPGREVRSLWSLIIYWTTSAVNTSAWKKDNFFVVGWRKIRMSKWRPGKIISFSHLYNFSLSRRAKSLTRTISWNASNPTILNLIPRTNSCFRSEPWNY